MKAAVVTGSALNIGRATAQALARDGYSVMVTARSSDDDCTRTVELIKEAGGEAAVHLADISDPQQAKGLIEATVARFGRLDALVNNASIRRQTKFSELTIEEWREIMGTTLDGAFYCVHAAAPHLLASGEGCIVNLGGMSSHLGAKGRVHAITAKAGMVGMTRALAKELAPTVTVNCVVPGTIDTVRGFAAGGNAGRASLPDNLMGRPGKREEIAEMVRYLCSPVARFITGQTIHVNGGAFMP